MSLNHYSNHSILLLLRKSDYCLTGEGIVNQLHSIGRKVEWFESFRANCKLLIELSIEINH